MEIEHSTNIKSEELKDLGNKYFKSENYKKAIEYYTQAISSLCFILLYIQNSPLNSQRTTRIVPKAISNWTSNH